MCNRIMVVDDHEDARELLSMVLSLEGYDPITAENGLVALHLARQDRPCLILLDIMMPVLDGLGFRKAQLGDPEIASIPVVCLSAITNQAVKDQLEAECLSKPVDIEQLLGLVRRHCPQPAPAQP
jgi:CheY-like chemotaxis protein